MPVRNRPAGLDFTKEDIEFWVLDPYGVVL